MVGGWDEAGGPPPGPTRPEAPCPTETLLKVVTKF